MLDLLSPADLAKLPQDWTREQFDEMLDHIRNARAAAYCRAMRTRKQRDLSGFVTQTNISDIWDGQERRTTRSRDE